MQTDFYRIKRLPPYIFEEVNRLKAQARARGEDIIDFGMGNPDMATPDFIVDKLCETARDPRAHRYSASRGIKGLRKAHCAYYKRRFGVELNPDREVIAALGSKEGFANLAMAITAPGDVVLVPNPAYPIHAFGFMIAGAAIRHVPATSPEEYLSKIGVATRHSVPSPLAMVVNYPSNPTAQVVGLDFYKEVIRFAKKHEIWVLSDLAYADIYFDDANYGAFTPIQVAAAAALNGPVEMIDEIRAVYKSRRDVLVKSMAQAGWDIPAPEASMFAWAPVPEKYREKGSMEFAKDLLIHAKVAVSPGIGFGEYGEGYVRVALVENEHRIRQAARNVKKFLAMGTNMAPSDLADAK
jgi:alanine-synthesizing transaminase